MKVTTKEVFKSLKALEGDKMTSSEFENNIIYSFDPYGYDYDIFIEEIKDTTIYKVYCESVCHHAFNIETIKSMNKDELMLEIVKVWK